MNFKFVNRIPQFEKYLLIYLNSFVDMNCLSKVMVHFHNDNI